MIFDFRLGIVVKDYIIELLHDQVTGSIPAGFEIFLRASNSEKILGT